MQQIQIGDIIDNQFQIKRQLSQGSFGMVFFGKSIKTNKKVAIKVEKKEMASYNTLEREAEILRKLQGVSSIPELFWYGMFKGCNVMVLKMLGRDLIYFQKKHKQLSVGCVYNIAYQVIGILEQIHKKNIIHRDLKPENILGKNESDKLYLIDFGISKEIDYLKSNKREKLSFIGTSRYASLAAHKGVEQGKKDDLESLGYVLIYFITQELPWMNFEKTDSQRIKRIGNMKEEISTEELCLGCPPQISKYMNHVRELNSYSKPRYAMLRGLFLTPIHKGLSMQLDWSTVKETTQKNQSKLKEKRKSHDYLSSRQIKRQKSPISRPSNPNTMIHLLTLGVCDEQLGSSEQGSGTQFSVNETNGSNQSVKVGFTVTDCFHKFKSHQMVNRVSTLDEFQEDDPIISIKAEQQLMQNENQDLEIKYNLLHFRSVYFNYKNPIQHFALKTHFQIKQHN